MGAVDNASAGARYIRQQSAGTDVKAVGFIELFFFFGNNGFVYTVFGGHILLQVTAQDAIDQLQAAANTQYWYFPLLCRFEKAYFKSISFFIELLWHIGVYKIFAIVKTGMNVYPAG
jgi:hypothetical protein